jgi:hypothetical protein
MASADELRRRFEVTGDLVPLEECVDLYRLALTDCPSGSPFRLGLCANLDVCLKYLFEHTGNQSLLEEAISFEHEAARLRLAGYPEFGNA